jgi:hypothetical protein
VCTRGRLRLPARGWSKDRHALAVRAHATRDAEFAALLGERGSLRLLNSLRAVRCASVQRSRRRSARCSHRWATPVGAPGDPKAAQVGLFTTQGPSFATDELFG